MRFFLLIAAAFLLFSIIQLYAGFVGMQYHLGSVGAILIMIISLRFRFTLPITIGAFFCALDVWNWHWVMAILFVAPGLAVIVPGSVMLVITGILARAQLNKAAENSQKNPDSQKNPKMRVLNPDRPKDD
jgi:hypothetical protein